MATHHFQPTRYYTAIGSHEAVLRIADGDTVFTTTVDAMGQDASNAKVTPAGNPQSGPFFVTGAEPGDTLVVQLDRIAPNRVIGYSSTVVAANVVDPSYVRELPERELAEWHVDNDLGTATLIKPDGSLSPAAGLEMPEDSELLELYRHLVTARRFEHQATLLARQGRLTGRHGLGLGLARHPAQHHEPARQREQRRDQRGVVHGVHERVVRRHQQ